MPGPATMFRPLARGLARVAAVVTLCDPWALLQPGFWLSFVAVALLMATDADQVVAATWRVDAGASLWRRLRGQAWASVRGMLRTQLVATVGLAPLTMAFFHQVSLVGLLANLVAIPLVTLAITPLGLLGVLAPPLWTLGAACVEGLGALLQAKAQAPVAVSAVMSIYTKQPDAILADAALGLKTLKDFKGKTLATPTFSASNVLWPLVLEANGMKPEDVKIMKVDPGAMGPMMANGQVDGTINWVTKLPGFEDLMNKAGKTIAVIPWSDYGFEGYGLSVVASDKFIKEKPELVRKVVKVYRQALQMAVADPQAAGNAIKALVPEIDATVAAKEFAASVSLIDNEISKKDGLGAFEPKLLAKTWEWVAKAQSMPLDKLDPETAVNRSFVAE